MKNNPFIGRTKKGKLKTLQWRKNQRSKRLKNKTLRGEAPLRGVHRPELGLLLRERDELKNSCEKPFTRHRKTQSD